MKEVPVGKSLNLAAFQGTKFVVTCGEKRLVELLWSWAWWVDAAHEPMDAWADFPAQISGKVLN